jgi:GNAT superfamily N-acetyltransferase
MDLTTPSIICRPMERGDVALLNHLGRVTGHILEPDYFETTWQEVAQNKRQVICAHAAGQIVGYAHLNFHPLYQPFQRLGIPELQDLYVHPDYRRQGLGRLIIDHVESLARQNGYTELGIGVGITADFGSAQRLYTKCGFIPDGAGVVQDRIPVPSNTIRPIDGRMCIMMVKIV